MARLKKTDMVLVKVDGAIKEIEYGDALPLRKANMEAAKNANEPTFDGVILCPECGYTKRYVNNQCFGCRQVNIQNAKMVRLLGKAKFESASEQLDFKPIEVLEKDLDRAMRRIGEQQDIILRANSETEQLKEKLKKMSSETELLKVELAEQAETNAQLAREMLALL